MGAPPSFTPLAPLLCTLPGFGVRASAGADYRAGGVTESAGEEWISNFGKWGNGEIEYIII